MGDSNVDFYYKIIRDPIYGYIGLSERELIIIDTPRYQRLRRIKQLAMTDIIYPGAVHTRFEHSLGVLNVAGMILNRLYTIFRNDIEDILNIEAIRAAALLHDIGHGPFSHAFEPILMIANDWNEDINHETMTIEILKNDGDIGSALEGNVSGGSSFDDIHDEVIRLLENKTKESVAHDIISGPLDADKLDYLRRDSYHCGVAYGMFDFHRVIHTITMKKYPRTSHLVVLEKGKDSLESYRLARYLMHTQVYQHHVRAITDGMLTKAAEYAFREGVLSKEELSFSKNDDEFLEYYTSLTDEVFLHDLYKNSNGPTKEIIKSIYERKLLKRGFEKNWQNLPYEIKTEFSKLLESPAREKFPKIREIETRISEKVNTKPCNIILYPLIINVPLYRSPDIYSEGLEQKILIKMKNGEIRPLDEVSKLTTREYKFDAKLFVFCPPSKIESVQEISERVIKEVLNV